VLLRLTVALVLAGLGLLVAGFVRDALGLIYLSILCTAIAGVALIVYVQVTRRHAVRSAAEGDPVEGRAPEDDANPVDATGGDDGPGHPEVGRGPGGSIPPGQPAGSEPPPPGDAQWISPPGDNAGPDGMPGTPFGTSSGEETPEDR
jgi:hypothetical protein